MAGLGQNLASNAADLTKVFSGTSATASEGQNPRQSLSWEGASMPTVSHQSLARACQEPLSLSTA